jgi:hypothetical protein
VLKIGRNSCPYCGGTSHIYASRFKNLWEVAAIFLLLRPVRCHDCLSRFYRPIFIKAAPPPVARMDERELEGPTDSTEDDRRSA